MILMDSMWAIRDATFTTWNILLNIYIKNCNQSFAMKGKSTIKLRLRLSELSGLSCTCNASFTLEWHLY